MNFEKKWVIQSGLEKNEIEITENFDYYDFEIWNDSLYICDVFNKQVKVFDEHGNFTKSIKVPEYPELIKVWENVLFILTTNGSMFKWIKDVNNIERLNPDINSEDLNYETSFFLDKYLVIPLESNFWNVKSDAIIISLDSLYKTNIKHNFFDKKLKTLLPINNINFKQPRIIRQINYCGCNENYIIISSTRKNSNEDEYIILYDRINDKYINLGEGIFDRYGILILHTHMCRGFKIYGNKIYFIGITYDNGVRKELVVGLVDIPQK
jgi:hypothetical protein